MNFNYKWNFREQYAKIDKLVLEHIRTCLESFKHN